MTLLGTWDNREHEAIRFLTAHDLPSSMPSFSLYSSLPPFLSVCFFLFFIAGRGTAYFWKSALRQSNDPVC